MQGQASTADQGGPPVRVTLTKGQSVLVDAEHAHLLTNHSWKVNERAGGYVVRDTWRGGVRVTLSLHRLIARAPVGLVVDHINGDPLDNRTCNLRICTHAENQRNRGANRNNKTGLKGVVPLERRADRSPQRWGASIRHERKQHWLGSFETPEAAHAAYCEAAQRLHGAFARC